MYGLKCRLSHSQPPASPGKGARRIAGALQSLPRGVVYDAMSFLQICSMH
jgi:hypothetical protein